MTPTNTSLQNLNEQQRKTLIESIRSGECVLVLGPYANVTDDGRAQRVRLANHLSQRLPTAVVADTDEADSLGNVICRRLLDPNYNRGDILKETDAFYRQQRGRIVPDSPYDLILRLGFQTIFNTDPDSRLMKAFDDRNRNPLGLYFTQVPQPDIVPYLTPPDGMTDETPVIVNLFGLRDRPDSLAIGPEEELRQLYALTSGEMANKINLRLAPRLTRCRWYLFVGFNFNSWALSSIVYFISRLTEKVREARVFGLHSKPDAQLLGSTVVYYKNLIPNERNKNDVLIDHLDAQTFFRDLNALAEQMPPPPPPATQTALIVFHPRDRDQLAALQPALDAKLQEYDLTVQYSQPLTAFDRPLTDEQVQQGILTADIVLLLLSTSWDDFRYDAYLDLTRQRDKPAAVKGILLDDFPLFGPNRQRRPMFSDGSVKLFNNQHPLSLPDDLNAVVRDLDGFLDDTFAYA